jgi:hypothetical protein
MALVSVAGGCGRHSSGADRFVPSPPVAQAAVESAMKVWQRGEPAGEIRDGTPRIQVVDTHRTPNQKLESFDVLGEVGSDSGRCFLIRLVFENPSAEVRARYVVFGIDPLWVFREEDYTMISHWDHSMPAAPKTATPDAGSTDQAKDQKPSEDKDPS